jgi:hypothetical protein
MIVLVCIYAFDCVILLEVVLDKKIQDLCIDRDLREAYENTARNFLNSDLIEPWMLSDVCDLEALLWICVQDIGDEVSGFWGYEFGYRIFSIKDLFIKVCSVRIFEREIATDHSKQNYTAAPNVNIGTKITFPCNHFWSSITRRSACRFQSFPSFVSIRETEVDYLDIFPMI